MSLPLRRSPRQSGEPSSSLPDFFREFVSISDFLAWWLENPVLPEPQADEFNTYYRDYRTYFGPYIRHHYADQSREIEALIQAKGRPRLLEVGGGCGTEALWFAMRGACALSIDVNRERLDVARARQAIVEQGIGRRLDLEFRHCSLFDLPEEERFDLIWMEQAFHHVEPREQVYTTISHLLATDGHVVISEANGWNPLLQLVLFRRRGFRTVIDRTTSDGRHIVYGNERVTIPSAIARGFSRAGIEPKSVRYFRMLPNVKAADRLMPLEDKIPQFAAPLFSHYNYVGRRQAG